MKINAKNNTVQPYEFIIGRGILESGECITLESMVKDKKCLVISDGVVSLETKHFHQLIKILKKTAKSVGTYVSPIDPSGNERNKSIYEFIPMIEAAERSGLDRDSYIIGIGGGVIGDMAGFLASSYMRGIKVIHIPTTLMAQVDSSIGGKTGINLPGAKNMLGSFHQPSLIIADIECLLTLPDREIRSGMAEVVKYSCIHQTAFFYKYLMANLTELHKPNPKLLHTIVEECSQIKASYISLDTYETEGIREILNYGHTFGHAIESVAGFGKFTHGEAVSIGMCIACDLALLINPGSNKLVELSKRQSILLESVGLPTYIPVELSLTDIMSTMVKDKKNKNGKYTLILPGSDGALYISNNVDKLLVEIAIKGRYTT